MRVYCRPAGEGKQVDSSGSIPRFGVRVAGEEYLPRPGAYVILRDALGAVAVVRTPEGTYLPGGGQHPGETLEQAAVREVAEECGLQAEILGRIGVADQLAHSAAEGKFFEKRSTFLRGRVVGRAVASEADHVLCWLSPAAAEEELSHESHRWAVRREAGAQEGAPEPAGSRPSRGGAARWPPLAVCLGLLAALGPLHPSAAASVAHHGRVVLLWWTPAILLLAGGIARMRRGRRWLLALAAFWLAAVFLMHPVCDAIPPEEVASFEAVMSLQERAGQGEPFCRIAGRWYQCKRWLARQFFF
jgi:ADP-ribose pyrophosphatase YjhB (NUDIX family)